MGVKLLEIEGQRCLVFDAGAAIVTDAGGARDLIEEAMNHHASIVAVPATTLDAAFFQLRSGVAGEILQKLANYRLKLAVLGEISAYVTASDALRDFVVESNRGSSVFFVPDLPALAARLADLRSPTD